MMERHAEFVRQRRDRLRQEGRHVDYSMFCNCEACLDDRASWEETLRVERARPGIEAVNRATRKAIRKAIRKIRLS